MCGLESITMYQCVVGNLLGGVVYALEEQCVQKGSIPEWRGVLVGSMPHRAVWSGKYPRRTACGVGSILGMAVCGVGSVGCTFSGAVRGAGSALGEH